MLIFMLSLFGMPTFQKSKCKKLLETTTERIQHLKSRHEVQLKQLLHDVFELVERGKHQKAAAWINRIWKESCLITVYTKIQEYCDTVRINLSNIAGQKECPIDLEEPVATLCYAASCFADLPELQEIRQIFAMKYRCEKYLVASTTEYEKCDPHVNKEIVNALSTDGPSEDNKEKLLMGITNRKYKMNPSDDEGTSDDGGSRKNGLNPCSDILTELKLMQKKQFKEMNMVKYETNGRQDIRMPEVEAKLLADGRPMKKMPSDKQVKDSPFKRQHRRASRRRTEEEANDGVVNPPNQMQHGYVDNASVMVSDYHQQQPRTPRRLALADNYQLQAVSNRYGPPQRAPPPPQRAPPPPPLMPPSPKPALPPPSRPPPLPSTSINRVASMPNFQNLSKHPSPPRSTTLEDHERRAKQGIYVHPKLPDYDELVAQFTKKSNLSE